jgi:hypothetical protein
MRIGRPRRVYRVEPVESPVPHPEKSPRQPAPRPGKREPVPQK